MSALTRPDAAAKASGTARYTADLTRPGMLHGFIVRCWTPHARLLEVDVAEAAAVDGVAAVLTAADLPGQRYGLFDRDEPVLAIDRVTYAGEPIALVAARDRETAERAGALVNAKLEVLEAVTDLAAAAALPERRLPGARIERGYVLDAFAVAHAVVETRIESQRAHQTYIEPRAALAEVDDLGRLVVTTTSQIPFGVRDGLAVLFERDPADVVVRVPALGGGFGGKLHLGVAPHASALALATGRPVRVLCTREEELRASNPRENSIVTLESAVDASGRILARRTSVALDSGAYAVDTPAIASTASLQASGPYAIEHLSAEVVPVMTNTMPTGSFRAPSGPQLVYANEVHIEQIAERLGLSARAVRERNLPRAGASGPTGQAIGPNASVECLDAAADLLDQWRSEVREDLPPGVVRGWGMACAWWSTMHGGSSAALTARTDGRLVLRTGATEIGTGAVVSGVTALVARELGVELDAVRLESADTDRTPYDLGSEGSRTLYGAGSAAHRAAVRVRNRIAAVVAEELGVDADGVTFAEGRVWARGAERESMPLGEAVELVESREGPLVESASFEGPPVAYDKDAVTGRGGTVHNEPTWHAHAVEIELDRLTGRIAVSRYAAVHDVGTVVNREGVIGQIQGGVVQGVGYALYEEMQMDERGTTRNADLHDYRIPTTLDVPRELTIRLIESYPATTAAHGGKGIGEAPILLSAAAIASAVHDITGRHPTTLPMSPDRILTHLSTSEGQPHAD